MQEHRVDIRAETSAEAIAMLLDSRPASWLRPFLTLAVAAHPVPEARPWFRLARQEIDEPGGSTSWTLRWRPRRGPTCFEDLIGHLTVEPEGSGARFAIDATVLGSDTASTHRDLQALLELLDGALAERQDAG